MDGSHFDALSRALADTRPRRSLARVLAGFALGRLVTLGALSTEAKKKKRKRKKQPLSCPAAQRCGRACCAGGQFCCDDLLGRCCARPGVL